MPEFEVRVARIGSAPAGERYRVLVDRLWPRGVRKGLARWDEWCKDVAPSSDLRRWYGHDPARFKTFRQRYRRELGALEGSLGIGRLLELAHSRPVVLLTASADIDHSQAPVLAQWLTERLHAERPV